MTKPTPTSAVARLSSIALPNWSTMRPPKNEPRAMITWNIATNSGMPRSTSLGATTNIQMLAQAGKAPKAKPQSAISMAAPVRLVAK